MSFDDLPDDWPQRPLTDPQLVADVLDLVVSESSRWDGALYVLMCDEGDRLVNAVAINELEPDAGFDERTSMLRVIIGAGENVSPDGSALIAIARREGLSTTTDDDLWASSAMAALRTWRLLGVHVVTMRGSRPIPRTVSAA